MNRFFILLLSVVSLLCACGKTRKSYIVKGEFRYYNRVADTIRVYIKQGLNKAYESYTIPSGDSLILFTMGETDLDQPVDPGGYVPAITGDTTVIQFSDTLCYSEYRPGGAILHNIYTYSYLKKGDKEYIFYFDIDSSLLQFAGPCP